MPLSERKKAHQDDAPQSVHNLTEVSKNAFVEPFSAPQNYVTNHPREFTQQPNLVLHFCGAWVYRQSERRYHFDTAAFLFIAYPNTQSETAIMHIEV